MWCDFWQNCLASPIENIEIILNHVFLIHIHYWLLWPSGHTYYHLFTKYCSTYGLIFLGEDVALPHKCFLRYRYLKMATIFCLGKMDGIEVHLKEFCFKQPKVSWPLKSLAILRTCTPLRHTGSFTHPLERTMILRAYNCLKVSRIYPWECMLGKPGCWPIFITWTSLLRKVGSLKMEPKIMLLNFLKGGPKFCLSIGVQIWAHFLGRRSLFNQPEMSSHYVRWGYRPKHQNQPTLQSNLQLHQMSDVFIFVEIPQGFWTSNVLVFYLWVHFNQSFADAVGRPMDCQC